MVSVTANAFTNMDALVCVLGAWHFSGLKAYNLIDEVSK
jgi:hypothetical protein